MVTPAKQGYRQDKAGFLPDGWSIVRLGDVVYAVEYGSSAKSHTNGRVPVLRMGNLQNGKIDWSNLVYTSDENEIQKYALRYGDVLFNRTNTIDLVGKTSIYLGEKPAIFAGYLIRVICNPELINSQYLNFILNTEDSKRYGQKVLSVAVGQANINGQKLKTYPIPLPPLAEQNAIVEALSDADSLIASLQKLITKKKAIKQGAMQELLTGKRRLPGFSGEWVACGILDALEKNSGIKIGPFGSQLRKEFLLERGQYKVYGQENVYKNDFTAGFRYLSLNRYQQLNSCEIIAGDFLISSMGTVGKCAIVPTGIMPGIMDSHLIRLRFNPKKLLPNYVVQLFSSEFYFLKRQTGKLSVGGIMDGLSTKIVSALQVIIPVDTKEQIAIAQVLSDMDTEIEHLEKKLSKYQQSKQGMMQELLTGRIRLPVKARNYVDDAVILSDIVHLLYSDDPKKYPLGRKKIQKVMYLLLRREKRDVSDFMKMVAGPYSPSVRYNSEPLALERGYINTEKGDRGTVFSPGENIQHAQKQMMLLTSEENIHWLVANFKHMPVNDLELFATVDMAICDLHEHDILVSVSTIKELILSTEEWRAKLDKTYFSDQDIQRAINKCREFFGEQ